VCVGIETHIEVSQSFVPWLRAMRLQVRSQLTQSTFEQRWTHEPCAVELYWNFLLEHLDFYRHGFRLLHRPTLVTAIQQNIYIIKVSVQTAWQYDYKNPTFFTQSIPLTDTQQHSPSIAAYHPWFDLAQCRLECEVAYMLLCTAMLHNCSTLLHSHPDWLIFCSKKKTESNYFVLVTTST
jgi:hypothetical protein